MNPIFEYDFETEKYTKLNPQFVNDLPTLTACSKIIGLSSLVYIDEDDLVLHRREGNDWVECNDDPVYLSCLVFNGGGVVGMHTLDRFAKPIVLPFEKVVTGKHLLIGPSIDGNVYGVDRHYLVRFDTFKLEERDLLFLNRLFDPLEYIRRIILKKNIAGITYYNDKKAYSVSREEIEVFLECDEKLHLYKAIFS